MYTKTYLSTFLEKQIKMKLRHGRERKGTNKKGRAGEGLKSAFWACLIEYLCGKKLV